MAAASSPRASAGYTSTALVVALLCVACCTHGALAQNATSTPPPPPPPATTGNSSSTTATEAAASGGGDATTTGVAVVTTMAPTTTATAASSPSNASTTSSPLFTPSPTSAGFVLGIRLFTLTYRIAGASFGIVLAQSMAALQSAVAVDIASSLGTQTQLVLVRRLEVGSLVLETDIHADGSPTAPAATTQQAALDQRYLASAHDFPSVRAVYFAVNGNTGEGLLTISINMTNRASSGGGGPVATPPSGPVDADNTVEECGFACGVFVAAVVIFVCVVAGVVAYVACCRGAATSAVKKAAPTSASNPTAPSSGAPYA